MTRHSKPLLTPFVVPFLSAASPNTQSLPSVLWDLAKSQKHCAKAPSGLLDVAKNCRLMVDLGRQLKFPQHIATMTLRPDIVLIRKTVKNGDGTYCAVGGVNGGDLWEEEEEVWGLGQWLSQTGWRMRYLPVEVGCRGFVEQSLCSAYSVFGITGEGRRRAIYNSTEAREKAFSWIWIKRSDPWDAAGTQAEAWSTFLGGLD